MSQFVLLYEGSTRSGNSVTQNLRFPPQIYRILGRTVVTYPKLLDETDFYMALDMSLLIDEIKVTKLFKGGFV